MLTIADSQQDFRLAVYEVQVEQTYRMLRQRIPGCRAKPKNQHFPILPNASGRPGFMATFQSLSSPSDSNACFTKSESPTEAPAVVMTTFRLLCRLRQC